MHVCLYCNQQVLATGSSLLDPAEVEAKFNFLADAANLSNQNLLMQVKRELLVRV